MQETGRSILVIDDNRWLRDELVGLLTDEGYHAFGVADGRQAIERLRSAPAPGLILLDVHMPVLDGFGFFAEQQADPLLAPIPVVVLTTERGRQTEELRLRADAWLEKPFSIGDLFGLVERHCGPPPRRPDEEILIQGIAHEPKTC